MRERIYRIVGCIVYCDQTVSNGPEPEVKLVVTREQIKKSVMDLLKQGAKLFKSELAPDGAKALTSKAKDTISAKKPTNPIRTLPFEAQYQSWYTQALPLVKLILPDRYAEFVEQYKIEKRNDKTIDILTYTISDYLLGLRVTRIRGMITEEVINPRAAFSAKFRNQLWILQSCLDRLDSVLSDLRETMEAELFGNELDASEELLKKGHVRAAGALAGVTLERHLHAVAARHSITIPRSSPTISVLNDALKKALVLETAGWRFIQRLGDLRNRAVHATGKEPVAEEMTELINGVRKVTKPVW